MYDEKFFKKSANKKAMLMWLLTAVILSIAYTVEVIKGGRTPAYYTIFISGFQVGIIPKNTVILRKNPIRRTKNER